MKVFGLTGGIASGKSTASLFFSEAGIPVIDADLVARELTDHGGRAHDAVLKRFGTTDRAKLRELVFADAKARADLEAILHPLIREESARRISETQAPLVIYEATLLVETGRFKDFDGLIVVEAPREERIQRLMARDHSTREIAEKILASQASDESRRAVATFVITNTGTLDELKAQVQALASRLGDY